MSIIVNMACGLANRMFQYSYYLYLKQIGYDALVDYSRVAKLKHEVVFWEKIFPHAYLPQASYFKILKLGGGKDIISKIVRKYLPSLTSVHQMQSAFDVVLPYSDNKDAYMIGVFQNAEMVSKISNQVRHKFQFAEFQDEYNLSLQREMKDSQSIAIHVRKAKDYTTNYWFKDTCPLSYYINAVKYMNTKVDNPKYYVFTDNPEWVKENFDWLEYKLVDHNPSFGWGNHFDMQLMSSCHHNIISNSTYAWWAAFINSNDGQIVIPKIWFNPNSGVECSSERLRCRDWVAL